MLSSSPISRAIQPTIQCLLSPSDLAGTSYSASRSRRTALLPTPPTGYSPPAPRMHVNVLPASYYASSFPIRYSSSSPRLRPSKFKGKVNVKIPSLVWQSKDASSRHRRPVSQIIVTPATAKAGPPLARKTQQLLYESRPSDAHARIADGSAPRRPITLHQSPLPFPLAKDVIPINLKVDPQTLASAAPTGHMLAVAADIVGARIEFAADRTFVGHLAAWRAAPSVALHNHTSTAHAKTLVHDTYSQAIHEASSMDRHRPSASQLIASSQSWEGRVYQPTRVRVARNGDTTTNDGHPGYSSSDMPVYPEPTNAESNGERMLQQLL